MTKRKRRIPLKKGSRMDTMYLAVPPAITLVDLETGEPIRKVRAIRVGDQIIQETLGPEDAFRFSTFVLRLFNAPAFTGSGAGVAALVAVRQALTLVGKCEGGEVMVISRDALDKLKAAWASSPSLVLSDGRLLAQNAAFPAALEAATTTPPAPPA